MRVMVGSLEVCAADEGWQKVTVAFMNAGTIFSAEAYTMTQLFWHHCAPASSGQITTD